jgi:hypothetical protein
MQRMAEICFISGTSGSPEIQKWLFSLRFGFQSLCVLWLKFVVIIDVTMVDCCVLVAALRSYPSCMSGTQHSAYTRS